MITVCLCAYNGAEYIGRQIASILTQLNQDDEIIFCDDLSSLVGIFERLARQIFMNCPARGKEKSAD
jgi:hypothetical protein